MLRSYPDRWHPTLSQSCGNWLFYPFSFTSLRFTSLPFTSLCLISLSSWSTFGRFGTFTWRGWCIAFATIQSEISTLWGCLGEDFKAKTKNGSFSSKVTWLRLTVFSPTWTSEERKSIAPGHCSLIPTTTIRWSATRGKRKLRHFPNSEWFELNFWHN